jgi:hypothetical protein
LRVALVGPPEQHLWVERIDDGVVLGIVALDLGQVNLHDFATRDLAAVDG